MVLFIDKLAFMISQTEENYLKALYSLIDKKGAATVNDISKMLEIKMPTVTGMVKKLAEKGLVEYTSYKPLRLTVIGQKKAALIVRKHRLTEMFLVEKMGFGWEEVHQIAEQVEHIQSPILFDRMDEILNYPQSDPHGSPIPNIDGTVKEQKYIALKNCKENDQVILSAVNPSSEALLNFLNSKELELGTLISVLHKESFDQSMTISYLLRKSEVLSSVVSSKLLVTHKTD